MHVALLVSADVPWALGLAEAWKAVGDSVSAVLLDEAASAVRIGHQMTGVVAAAIAAGVSVAVHDDAIRRRGIRGDGLVDGVKVVTIDEVADLVADGADKAVWL